MEDKQERNLDPPVAVDGSYTTNMDDLSKAAEMNERLRQRSKESSKKQGGSIGQTRRRLDSVEIAEGKHKYVLIRAQCDGEEQYFVTSKRGAQYHRNAAEPMIYRLEQAGYDDIEVKGGGRIHLDSEAKLVEIYGFSYGFGQADHSISQQVVQNDSRFTDFTVTISNDGY